MATPMVQPSLDMSSQKKKKKKDDDNVLRSQTKGGKKRQLINTMPEDDMRGNHP